MKCEFSIVLVIIGIVSSSNSDPVVHTPLGAIQGIPVTAVSGKRANAFLGIPYAEPPIGRNRFLPPTTKKPWPDIFVANSLPKSCVQFRFPDSKPWWVPKYEMSEDCLQLNIWVPSYQRPEKAAVMVWLHGGGLAMGSSNIAKFDGATLATEENVIFVSINYRLTVFGFLHVKDTDAKGNMGLLDQVQALKWIQQNIESFGGDKNRVTLFGVSAGGLSGALHIVSDSESNLHAVIIQSGVPETIDALHLFVSKGKNNSKPEDVLLRLADNLNCSAEKNNQAIVDCLRNIDAKDLMAQVPFMDGSGWLDPVADGQFLENEYKVLLQKKHFQDVSVMLGDTAQDGSVFASAYNPDICPMTGNCPLSRVNFLRLVKNLVPIVGEFVYNVIDFFYTDWHHPNDPVRNRDEAMKMYTDVVTTCPTIGLANDLVSDGKTVYQYQFNQTPSISEINVPWIGAFHGADVDFVFGLPLDPKNGFSEPEVTLSKNIMRYWANFAKYKNPNGECTVSKSDLPYWPQYTIDDKYYIDLSANTSSKKGLRVRQCAFWDKVFPELMRAGQTQKKSESCS